MTEGRRKAQLPSTLQPASEMIKDDHHVQVHLVAGNRSTTIVNGISQCLSSQGRS